MCLYLNAKLTAWPELSLLYTKPAHFYNDDLAADIFDRLYIRSGELYAVNIALYFSKDYLI